MDIVTQVILGAACGEVTAGRKLGNKAMLYGGIGGIIPDLDIGVGILLYADQISREAFHRGFMHSIVFAFLMAAVLAWLCFIFNKKVLRIQSSMRFKNWYLLWFMAIFTHPLLDSFTAFGTQLFLPFSSYRVAISSIAVVDFMYSLPFLFCLIVASFFSRTHQKRKKWAWAGIAISSFYLLFTVCNKVYVDHKIKSALTEQNMRYEKYFSTPTMFNNILWTSTAEHKGAFYSAYFSWFDNQPIQFVKIERNKHLLTEYLDSPQWKTLDWFTSGYNYIREMEAGKKYKLGYIKYGLNDFGNSEEANFSFNLIVDDTNTLELLPFEPKGVDKEQSFFSSLWSFFTTNFPKLWERMLGN